MKEAEDIAHMEAAYTYARLSKAERRKVACLIVKNGMVISSGINGTPSGWDNKCEDENNVTKPEVSHAEENAISRLARSSVSGEDASVYVTLAPCFQCSKMIANSGIKEVYFAEAYRDMSGVDYLLKRGVKVHQLVLKREPYKICNSIFKRLKNPSILISIIQKIRNMMISR